MRRILTALLSSAAVLAFASSAFAGGGCSFGHTEQTTASTVEQESMTMSTFDGDVTLPGEVAEIDEAAVVQLPSDEADAE